MNTYISPTKTQYGVITGFKNCNEDEPKIGYILARDGIDYIFNQHSLKQTMTFDELRKGDQVCFNVQHSNSRDQCEPFINSIDLIQEPVIDRLKSIMSRHYNAGETISLADLGPLLDRYKIYYKDLGCNKLKDFLRQCPHFLQIEDKKVSANGTQTYVTLIERDQNEQRVMKQMSKPHINREPLLFQWAYVPSFAETLERLRDLALPERWDYSNDDSDKLIILGQYIKYTFQRLYEQHNGILDTKDYAVFNTGLVDRKYKPIYALFHPNEQHNNQGAQHWRFYAFCVEGEGRAGKELIKHFKQLPPRARYFEHISDMFFDPTSGDVSFDDEHILIDNIHRLPFAFHKQYAPNDFSVIDPDSLDKYEKDNYFTQLRNAIRTDEKTYRMMTSRLRDAVWLAVKKTEWNFKTAIPMYNPAENTMLLLLPLSLVDDNNVDVALVVERYPSGRYIGHTILSLDMAYSNARLISRPDSDWLNLNKITHIEDNNGTIELEKKEGDNDGTINEKQKVAY